MRENCLSNRVFTSHENIIDHCCEAWNKFIDQPWRIMSLSLTAGCYSIGRVQQIGLPGSRVGL